MAWRFITAVCACLIAASGSAAGAAEDFYAGKTITLFAGFPPGGGVDGEMRTVAHHLPRFIPGAPTIIAKNMPGAGGIVLGNFLYKVTDADGLTLGMPGRSGFLLSNVTRTKGVQFELSKFAYVGGAGGTNSILWLRAETGVRSIADIARAKQIVLGAWSANSTNAIVPKVLAKYEKWPFKIVQGYPGTNEVMLAIERGEIDGLFSHEGTIQSTRPDLISSGKLKPVFQSYAQLPEVPVLSEHLKDPKERALLAMLDASSRIGLPLMAPPGLLPERLKILRAAYARMLQDKDYREEAELRGAPVGNPVLGLELEKMVVENLSSIPEDVLAEYQAYVEGQGGQ